MWMSASWRPPAATLRPWSSSNPSGATCIHGSTSSLSSYCRSLIAGKTSHCSCNTCSAAIQESDSDFVPQVLCSRSAKADGETSGGGIFYLSLDRPHRLAHNQQLAILKERQRQRQKQRMKKARITEPTLPQLRGFGGRGF